MRRYIATASEYGDYDVIVSFGGFVGGEEEITVYGRAGASEEDILSMVQSDYRDELLDGEVIDFDGEDGYIVEVTFAGYYGISEEYSVIADNEEDAIDQAIEEASWSLDIVSFTFEGR